MKQNEPTTHIGYFPEAPAPQKPPRKPPRRWPTLIAIGVCVCVFVTCAALLIHYYGNIAATKNASSTLGAVYDAANAAQATHEATQVPHATATPFAEAASTVMARTTVSPQPVADAELWPTVYPNNPKLKVSPVFDDLQKKNRDIIAWLKIDTELEEPVVQRDNVYYLTHNALNQKSVTGALFLDETCDLIHVPTQMVVHGHNMKEGAMFGALKKYKVKGAEYYKQHAYIDFNTVYENSRYVIFAVSEVEIRAGKPRYLPFWHYQRFPDEKTFMDYVNTARALSHYHCTVDVQPGDRLLTLSTCSGANDSERLLVMARQIRADEDLLALNMKVLSTYNK